jgi:hypothetical protein
MTRMRRIPLLATVPIAVVALSGAATSPTVTYHGVFDSTAVLSANCPAMLTSEDWSGVWNLQLKDEDVGSPVLMQMNLKFDGRPHAVFRLPFSTVSPGSGLQLQSVQDPAPGDHGEVALGEDGTFTYTRALHNDVWDCSATFNGHLTP